MDPGAAVRKFQLNGEGAESVVAGVRGVSVVGIRFGNLSEEAKVGGAAQGVVHDTEGLGHVQSNLVRTGVDASLLRNGNGLSPNRCGEDAREPLFVRDGGGSKLSIKDNTPFFGNIKSFRKLFRAGGGLGSGWGGVGIAAAGPARGGALARGIIAFSTIAERRSNIARLALAKSLSWSMLGLSTLAFMETALSEAVTMRALMDSQSNKGLGGRERGG
jgi:hypothetical protein